ncbi:hypothetical protein J4E85_000872 [Alternaria conjuncta]|uniref:uncharacterized protein n=1 Tax=Alternaria conjuncta TaxID=181017 RepID=UPI00222124D2|nr:uncharacterized protein J4E85_000872 [Alternaria conjuncta]KAI4938432.1 hypothetical protein J4E85_000872 [Alternaria conjuncta]
MAPSGTSMFSKLRPGHAKRNASSLASPEPVPSPSPAAPPLPSPSQSTEHFSSPRFNDNASYTSGSPISPYPPQLPPIARVASKLDKAASPGSSQYTASQHSGSTGGSSSKMAQDRSLLSPPQRTQDHFSPAYENKPLSARSHSGGSPLPQRTEPAPSSETPPQSSSHLAPSVISPGYSNFSKSQTSLLSGISDKLTGSSKGTSTPTAAPSKSRSRLTLRNPMSLLMRRRSGQTLDPLADESLVTQRSPSNVPPMPDNYDPSIRGKIVHDFNAPRLNRGYSYNTAAEGGEGQQEIGRASPPKIDKEHTPVFREHFDDDTSYEQSQAAIRAEQLVNKDFLARNSVQFPPPERSAPPPPQPKNSPPPPPPPQSSPLPPPQTSPLPRPSFQGLDSGSSVLSPVQESENPLDVSTDVTPRKRKSTKSPPPPARSRATSVSDPSFQPAGLPAHFSSRASRFSFQISGQTDSAQEKLLEERHKAKEAEKKQARISTNSVEDEYEDYGMDDYDDMDGGFDEEIPMLGEEDEFGGGLGDQTLDSGMNTFDFSSLSLQQNKSHTASPMNQMQTPVDMNGNPIGFAMSQEMLQQYQMLMMGGQLNGQNAMNSQTQGLGLTTSQNEPHESFPDESLETSDNAVPSDAKQQGFGHIDLGDDFDFDDGLIGDQDDIEPTEFDENVFDDPNGPLYERKVKFAEDEQAPAAHQPRAYDVLSSETGYEADDDTVSKHLEKSSPTLAHKTSIAQQRPVPSFENLSAYHSALADAATRAEAAGRFTRKASVDVGRPSFDADDQSSLSNSRPSLVPDDGRFSVDTISFPQDDDVYGMSSGFVNDDYDYSDFDSAMEDDPIIAEANAEALAYDDEGFYGQEFGFYASAVGESPSAWGGFFGPSGMGLGRTVSGRNAVREPNLTPITERSEYSTRNSFISLNHFRDGNQPMSSPGLAQLARMSPYGFPGNEEEDMSLDTLLKLRKGAFGGSVASLPVSAANSPRNSSPMGMQFVPRASSPVGNRMKEHPSSSLESSYSSKNVSSDYHNDDNEDEEDDDGLMDAVNGIYESGRSSSDSYDRNDRPESPTLTSSDYNSLSSPTGYGVGNEAPLLPPISELYAQHNMTLAMSPGGLSATSPSNISLPVSPFPMPLSSPFLPQHVNRPPNPPSIDTSLSSPSAPTVSTTGGQTRRQSMGLSPISNSSPITPNGGNGGSGWNRGHSRKGSAADSVTYVREHDEAGEGRWVLERRRTAESGELELIGREIVEGGRI